MELGRRTSTEKYNPITGTAIPVHPPRTNTSAIFGSSPGNIEYMFIPPSATTRPAIPTTTSEKRRSLSRESLRRSIPTVNEGLPDSDECSSISDVSECSSEAEHRERTRTSSGSLSKKRKPVTRSASSRLPVAASKPSVMKRAHSFTRGTDSCVPRAQINVSCGPTNNPQQPTTTSDLSSQPRRPSTGGTSNIPRKANAGPGPQTSRIPLKRADVNSNVAERQTERSGKENTLSKRTASVDSKISGIAGSSSNKQSSSEFKEPCKSEPVISKQSAVSGIPVKGSKLQKHSGTSRLPPAKQDGGGPRVRDNVLNKHGDQTQNIDKENDDNKSSKEVGKPTLKRDGTGNESRVAKSDVTKSKLPRKSNIPKSNVVKTTQQKTRNNSNTELEIKTAKTNEMKAPNQESAFSQSTRPAEAKNTLNTSNTLQRSDSGFGDTESVSSKDDALVLEPGNEFSLSRENSKSKIPIKSRKSRGTAKPSREVPSNDDKRPENDTKKAENEAANGEEFLKAVTAKLDNETAISEKDNKTSVNNAEADRITSESDKVWVYKIETSHKRPPKYNVPDKRVESNTNRNNENGKTSSKENNVSGLGTRKGVEVTSQIATHDFPNKDVEQETDPSKQIQDNGYLHGNLGTRISASNNEKATMPEPNTGLPKSGVEIQDAGSLMNTNDFIMKPADRVISVGNENILHDSAGERNGGEKKENNNVDIKMEFEVSNQKQIEPSNEIQSAKNLKSHNGETASKTNSQKDVNKRSEIEKPPTKCLENERETVTRKTTGKQSPRKPPRLSKLLVHDETENNVSTVDTRQENVNAQLSKEESLDKEASSFGNVVRKRSGAREMVGEPGVGRLVDVLEPDDVGQSEGMGQLEVTGQPDDVGVNEEDPPRRSDNCMQCRMEQSMMDGEDLSMVENDPGFRQYPTFISPRKSLVTCKHHAKKKNSEEISREQSEEPPVAIAAVKNDHKSCVEPLKHELELIAKIFNTPPSNQGYSKDIDEVANIGGTEFPIGEKSRKISPKSVNTEGPPNATKNVIKDRSESLKTPRHTTNDSRQAETKNLAGPKGSHSPLLALSRDKKFASNSKPTEDIKAALSLEWDDTGTELSPPNFSDDDEDFLGPGLKRTEQDLEDSRTPSVKLMNTNEALDKLKVIQSLIMKEAENRNRKESEENTGKYAVGVKKTGTENAGKKLGNEDKNFGGMYGVSESTSNQVSPTFEVPERKISSPTIWDRITDRSMSQDQTTELLNETLAKLKASPKLSGKAFVRKSLSSRSLPGSRQASKEQLLSDGERPVYVYTSSWMNRSGKNSRGSSLSLCSANYSLPSSRQNLTKEPFCGLKRSESAAGRMERENGKRIEPKEFRLSDFDEINLSDDGGTELKSQKATTPKLTSIADKPSQNDGETVRKQSKRRKKPKNTAEKMNNVPAYDASMDDLTEGKTTCQCGGKNCVIM